MTSTVTIHGYEWELADIQEEIDWCRQRPWVKQRWTPTAALVQKNGTTSQYIGQEYDPNDYDLIEDGWTHDHCSICWFTLHESEVSEENTGWTDGKRKWLCCECYEKFIEGNPKRR